MWSIHDVGVVAVQLVRMERSGCASVSVRLGLSHPILLAQCCRAGWAPPFVCVGPAGVEVAHEERLVRRVALVFMHFSHDEILNVGKWVGLVHVWKVFER